MGTPPLRVRLLGGVDLRRGDEELPPLESARARSLLAYLLLNADAPQPRQRLAFLLWPDSSEGQARTNLRHLLHNLRRSLADADRFLEVTPRTLRWRPGAPYWLDVAAFEEALARADAAEHDPDAEVAALRDAAALYAGDLLAGSYDEWLLGARERLHHRHLAALRRLAELLSARGEHADATHFAQELLRGDPLQEAAYRLAMRVHAAAGDRARAVRAYHACATMLRRELGAEPSAATEEAHRALTRPDRRAPEPRPGGASPPLVGRADEWAALTGCWRAAERGPARLVVVAGEAGIGKTRLVEELRTWCAQRGAVVADARSYPAEGELAYGATAAWLRADGLAARVRRLGRFDLTELARLLPELLAEGRDLAAPEPLPESEQRRRLFDAVARAVLVPGQPALLVADDAHWCDPQSLALLHYLLRAGSGGSLLVVATVRREALGDDHPVRALVGGLHALDRCVELELGRLAKEETAELARHVAGADLDGAGADALHAETEGNPLFVVETVRAGRDAGRRDRPALSPKLQSVIGARLAQLSPHARALVGVAATVGRDFTSDVVAGASGVDEVALVGALDELWRRGIVRERGVDAYDFSHEKVREVAYLSLGAATRRRHHLRVAEALLAAHAGDPGPVSGRLAAHYERGGATADAVAWYGRAAEQAQRLHANAEAVRLLGRALELTAALPGGEERRTRELAVLSALPTPLAAVEGFGSERLAETQRRAVRLAGALGREPEPPLLRSLAMSFLSRGDFDAARRVGAELGAWGARAGDDVLLVEGDYLLGIAAFWAGALADARAHFERAVRRARPEHRATHLLRYGQDPEVACLGRLANTLWFLGHPADAKRARDAAVALADEVGHPHSRDTALVFAALLALELEEADRCREHVAGLAAGGAEHRTRPVQVAAEALAGYADVLDGRAHAGVARIRRAVDQRQDADHAPGMGAVLLRLLLAAHEAAPDVDGALAATDEALALGGCRLWESEAHRRRAELLHARGAPTPVVEAALARALGAARRSGARALELRAARSRARLGFGGAAAAAEERSGER